MHFLMVTIVNLVKPSNQKIFATFWKKLHFPLFMGLKINCATVLLFIHLKNLMFGVTAHHDRWVLPET